MSRFEAPFIFKIRFYKPEGKNASKNAAHIKYIGTRPGVAIDGEKDLYSENDLYIEDSVNSQQVDYDKQWFNEDHEHFQLDENEGVDGVVDPGTAAGHIKYAGERPGSHGLFDQESSNPNLIEIQKELSEHQGLVWRSILSLKENDAIKLGYIEKEAWEDTLRATVTEAASHMKIKESNLRWVAAYHAEAGHPHAHLVMWEKNPKRDRGMLSEGERADVKRTFMQEFYAEERTRMQQEKTVNRDLMRDLAKGDLQNYVQLLRDVKGSDLEIALAQRAIGNVEIGLAPKMYRADEREIVLGLQKVAEIMPKTGRIAFQYMDEDVKELTLIVTDRILSNAFNGSMKGFMNAVEEQTLLHTNNPEKIEIAKQNAYKDIQKRVANAVIGAAAEVNRTSYLEVDEKAVIEASEVFLSPNGKPQQDLNEDIVKAVTEHLRLYNFKKADIEEVFEKWIPKIHTDKSLEEVKSIVSAEFEKERLITQNVERLSISNADISFLSKITGKDLENPNESIHYYETTLRSQLEMTAIMKTSIVPIENESNIDEIAVMLNAAMKESGIGFIKRDSLLSEWAGNNEVHVNFKEVDSATKKDHKLTKDDWQELCDRLLVDIKSVSWNEKTEIVLNPSKVTDLYSEFGTVTKIPKVEAKSYRELIEKIVPMVSKSESSLNKQLDKWNQLLPKELRFSEEEKNALSEQWKRNDVKNIRTSLSMLTSAGYSGEEVMKKISPFIKSEDEDHLSKYVRTVGIKINQDLSISDAELRNVGELINAYVFKKPDNYEIPNREKLNIVDVFKKSTLQDKDEKTIKSTIFWMNKSLIQSGIKTPERLETLNNWAMNNKLEDSEAFKKFEIEPEKKYAVSSDQWGRLCETLQLGTIRSPWEEKNIVLLQKEKMEEVLEVITVRYPTLENLEMKDKDLVRDFMIKGLANVSANKEQFADKLNTFMLKIPQTERLNEQEIETKVQMWKENNYLNDNQGIAVNRTEFKAVGATIGMGAFQNPYKYEKDYETSDEIKSELVETFKNSKLNDRSEEVVKSTSFWMNQTLIQSGVEKADRSIVMDHWAVNNEVENTEAYRTLLIDTKGGFVVGGKKWGELCEVLELGELKTPWENNSTLKLEKDKLEGVLKLVTSTYMDLEKLELNDKIQIRDFVVKGLANLSSNQGEFNDKIAEFMKAIPDEEKLTKQEITEHVHEWKRNDFGYVQNVLKVVDQVDKTVTDYSTVLKTLNKSDDEVRKIVTQWVERTSISIPKDKLEDLLDKSLISFNDKKAWGQTPTLSKESFIKLNENLSVESPYLWKSTFAPSHGLLTGLWKRIYSAVEEEKQQGQAEAELQRRQIERSQQQKQRLLRQRGQEKD